MGLFGKTQESNITKTLYFFQDSKRKIIINISVVSKQSMLKANYAQRILFNEGNRFLLPTSFVPCSFLLITFHSTLLVFHLHEPLTA